MKKWHFFSLDRKDIEKLCESEHMPQIHAKTLFRAAYKKNLDVPWVGETIPHRLQKILTAHASLQRPKILQFRQSVYDQSVKAQIGLEDGHAVETVIMPEKKRITLCLSSQVGCGQACSFCHTGRLGLSRNLRSDEIIGQVLLANRWIRENTRWLQNLGFKKSMQVTNIVFMGMGEPADNATHVVKAIQIMNDPIGLGIPFRRISVSSAGHVAGMQEISRHCPEVRFAVSVHQTRNPMRSKIMPINRRWPLETLFSALRQLPNIQNHGLLVQYTMIDSVNDSLDHAAELCRLLEGMSAKVNIIPFNEFALSNFRAPSPKKLEEFRNVLHSRGYRVMVRYSKGQDIAAACGQLALT